MVFIEYKMLNILDIIIGMGTRVAGDPVLPPGNRHADLPPS